MHTLHYFSSVVTKKKNNNETTTMIKINLFLYAYVTICIKKKLHNLIILQYPFGIYIIIIIIFIWKLQ